VAARARLWSASRCGAPPAAAERPERRLRAAAQLVWQGVAAGGLCARVRAPLARVQVPALRRSSSSDSMARSSRAAFSALTSRRSSRTSDFLCTRSTVLRGFSRMRRMRIKYCVILVSRCLHLWMTICGQYSSCSSICWMASAYDLESSTGSHSLEGMCARSIVFICK
jgi:hypothetical protein